MRINKKSLNKAVYLSIALSLCLSQNSLSKQGGRGWNNIVPLRSTRTDVERHLGASTDACRCIYKTKNETIFVDYAEARCKGRLSGWNVAPETVLRFTVYPSTKPSLSSLSLNVDRLVRTIDDDNATTTYYTDVRQGIRYAVQQEEVVSIEYIPSSEDESLRCEGFPAYGGGVTQYRPYSTFSRRGRLDTIGRLSDFAFQLETRPSTKGFVIAYAGKVSKRGEAKAMAEEARQYLVRKLDIPPDRVVAIDGGFRETAEYELYLIEQIMPPPTPIPTLSPKEVRIIRKGKQ